MAKKRKRASKKAERKVEKATAETAASSISSTEKQFRNEYAYVVKDLRTIFLLATVMFVLLISLNLFLR